MITVEISKDSKRKVDLILMCQDLQDKVKEVNALNIDLGRDLKRNMDSINNVISQNH